MESGSKTSRMKAAQLKRSKRSRMDLISCILEKSIEGTSEKRLLDACNLNISQFNLYRKFLVETGLLKVSPKEEGMDIFKATEKAREFLRDHSQVKAWT